MARPVELKDAPVAEGDLPRVTELVNQVDALATRWVNKLREKAPAHRAMQLAQLLEEAGAKPPVTQLEQLSFYFGLLTFPDTTLKIRMLQITSTEERLELLKEAFRVGRGGECAIM